MLELELELGLGLVLELLNLLHMLPGDFNNICSRAVVVPSLLFFLLFFCFSVSFLIKTLNKL